jgi:RNA polymerase sigma factor (sigma-70 family)
LGDADARDISQDCCVKLLQRWTRLDVRTAGQFAMYVFSTTRSCIVDSHRVRAGRSRETRRPDPESIEELDHELTAAAPDLDTLIDVRRLLEQLPELQRKALLLGWAGWTLEEISDALGYGKSTVSRWREFAKRRWQELRAQSPQHQTAVGLKKA